MKYIWTQLRFMESQQINNFKSPQEWLQYIETIKPSVEDLKRWDNMKVVNPHIIQPKKKEDAFKVMMPRVSYHGNKYCVVCEMPIPRGLYCNECNG